MSFEEELKAAQDILEKFLAEFRALAIKEGEDVIKSIQLAVIEGESGRDKVTDTSGNPIPERLAFELALMGRDLLRAWLESLIRDAIK